MVTLAKLKQSFAWWCFENKGLNPATLFLEARHIGYLGVDLLPREYWDDAIRAGLSVINIPGHSPLEIGFNHRENHDALINQVLIQMESAVKYKIPYLIVFSGNRKGIEDNIGLENTVAGLKRITPIAEKLGVTLVLEPLNSKIDHPDHQCDHMSWGVQVCEKVNSPNLKILYDVYHMQVMEGDVTRTIIEHIDFIAHIHIAGVPGRSNINNTQEVNYPSIIRTLKTVGYQGFIGQEFIPTGDPISALSEAYQICNL